MALTNVDEVSKGMIRKNNKKCYDCEDTFNLCDQLGIEPVIKIRENAPSL